MTETKEPTAAEIIDKHVSPAHSAIPSLLMEISEHIDWDPDEKGLTPHVEMDVTKVIHCFKRHWKDTEFASELVGLTKDTLYNSAKTFCLGSLVLHATGHLSEEDLMNQAKNGVKETKVFEYPMDRGLDMVAAMRTAFKTVREYRKMPRKQLSEYNLDIPTTGEKEALNAILDSVSMPPIETMVYNLKENNNIIAKVEEQLKDSVKVNKTLTSDIESLKDQLKDHVLKSSMASSLELEASHDGTIPSGKTVMKDFNDVFGTSIPNSFEVPTWEWDGIHPDVPAVDKNYIFRDHELRLVLYAAVTNQRAYFAGHTGTGKTTLIEQVAARLNQPVARVNFDGEVGRMDLIGRDTLSSDGKGNVKSKFVDGILPKAMAEPYWFICDELDFIRPDVAYVMQAALEGNSLRITEDGDRIVTPHPMFRMFATGNTVGQGDEHGMYQGARPQSLALLDRFTVWGKVHYLEPEQRLDLIKKHYPTMTSDQTRQLAQYVTEHIESFETNKITQPMSPRGMLAVARATVIIGSLKDALQMTVLDRSNDDDRSVLKGIIDRVVK